MTDEIKELFEDYYDGKITHQELIDCVHDVDENYGDVIV